MTVDGLGFEEVNQAVTSTETISGNYVYGTTAVTTATLIATNISGTTAIRGTSFVNPNGTLQSVLLGSGTTNVFGGKLQVGSSVTSAGSATVLVESEVDQA